MLVGHCLFGSPSQHPGYVQRQREAGLSEFFYSFDSASTLPACAVGGLILGTIYSVVVTLIIILPRVPD